MSISYNLKTFRFYLSTGLTTPVPPKAPTSPLPTWCDPNDRCKYHMQGRGHWTYDCYYLKHKIQDLIDKDLWSLYVSPISHPEGEDSIPHTHYQRQWHDQYWELWPANPISNNFWHSQNCRLATSIECYSHVYILHNLYSMLWLLSCI